MIEILTTGAANSVQDLGRFGYLDAGVSRSGAMDGPALEAANLMLGNDPDAPGLEIAVFPFRVRFEAATLVSVTGADCPVTLGGRSYPSWWVLQVRSGDVLELGLPRSGARAYIGFSGGISVPAVLGSASTDIKSGWGGFEGRGLRRGDRLELSRGLAALANLPGGFGIDPSAMGRHDGAGRPIRVLAGAEHAVFDSASLEAFEATPWRVTDEANRQGYRLAGVELKLTRGLELFSHGIMPGTVQVPPSGQPIIQLAEANTCGGYPKIAHVIEADLWRLAQAPVGSDLRFAVVGRHDAVEALKRQRSALDRVAAFSALARKEPSHRENLAGLAVK
ncbi:biotin-dependent carboxyltransferase family protein [Rhizobium daejeonense]|uniref:Biotin-dependent carboxyltransferase family protein n=1 Tax=Rhizobium daejeonense TaxID=240521 RepID=A0A6M1SD85_9HYPH|nr:biotin-dependent carboxyltransferase family protein [Rhizobium daejeonense]NGO64726.1 biotin-dependent carboxyltransferase family protein [Rhizobium daejeonense]